MTAIFTYLTWIFFIFITGYMVRTVFDNSKKALADLDEIKKELVKLSEKVLTNEETLNLLIALTQASSRIESLEKSNVISERVNKAVNIVKKMEAEYQKKEELLQRIDEIKRLEKPEAIKFNWQD